MPITGFALAAALAIPAASAGNTHSYFHDDEAALTAGSGLAITRTAGAVWYNPAGLGGLEQGEIEASGSLYGVARRRIPGAVSAVIGDETVSGDLVENQLFTVPTSLIWVWRLSERVSGGVGVFVTEHDAVSRHASLDTQAVGGGVPMDFDLGLDIDWQRTTYHAGPALGWQLHPRLRLGVSALGVYERLDSDVLLQSRTTEKHIAYERSWFWHTYEQTSAGAGGGELSLGVQWQALDSLHLGLTVRSPTLANWAQRDSITSSSSALIDPSEPGATTGSQLYDRASYNQLGWAWIEPWELAGGVALALERGWLAAQGSYVPAFGGSVLSAGRRPLWNASVGGQLHLRDELVVGLGLYTDRSPYASADSFGHERVDFYGLTLGLRFEKALRVVPAHGEDGADPDRIVFSSTWAVKYALGAGEARGLVYDATVLGAPAFEQPLVDVTYHELGLHFGSGLAF